jgi:hypothetical protein
MVFAIACSSGGGSSSGENPNPSGGGVDGGPINGAGTSITITTFVPGSAATTGGKTNATWAAFRKDDGSWGALTPAALAAGSYVFQTTADRWAVAFGCADDQNSLVAIHEDAITVTKANVLLESWCGPARPEAFTIAGTLSNVSATTSWLDFGYPLESRGVTLPLSGTNAAYEEVNVIAGTWDLAFGLRDDPGSTLTKMALLRGQALTADATVNVDLAGALAFAPGSRKLGIHAIDPNDNIAVPVRYATGAGSEQGIDLGPQNIASGADLDLTYATVPANVAVPTDRYHVALTASVMNEALRGVTASFHEAVDLDFTFPTPLDGITSAVSSSTPYIRLTTNMPTRPNTASVEASVVARITNKSLRVWRMSMGTAALAGAATATFAMPDLAAVPGFDTAWTLPSDIERDVTGTVREVPAPLADGTVTRFASRTIYVP